MVGKTIDENGFINKQNYWFKTTVKRGKDHRNYGGNWVKLYNIQTTDKMLAASKENIKKAYEWERSKPGNRLGCIGNMSIPKKLRNY